jgi:hypothetical protein
LSFYGDLKLDSLINFVLEKSNYSLDSLLKRGILMYVSLLDAFSQLILLVFFIFY